MFSFIIKKELNIMTSIADLVKDNPFYANDTGYYKKLIPEERFTEIVSSSDVKKALVQQIFIEVAQKVTLVALVVIPAIYITGATIVGAVLLGSLISVIATRPKDEGKDNYTPSQFNIINVVKYKANLLAALPKNQQYKDIFLRQLGVGTAIKVAFLGLTLLTPMKVATVIAPIGLYFAFYSLVQELDKLLLLCVDIYGQKQAEAKYKQMQSQELQAHPATC
jgi:hypothetical protein